MRIGVLAAAVWCAAAWAAQPIPPPPPGDDYLLDAAGLITPGDEAQVRAAQRAALNQSNSPIVVVTVSSASDYGEPNIDALATRWFNTWGIGTLGLQGGANQGILLLVGVQDRHARIELGGDWGHDWDAHAQQIMNGTIVPKFKAGDFSRGITDGVGKLAEMAKLGPHSHPPGDFLERRVRPMCKYSVLDPTQFLGLAGLGLALLLLGIFGRTNVSGLLIGAGLGLIVFAAFTYALIIVLALAFGRRGRSGYWGSGGGGGYSGGSSGGGGASGSW